MRRKYIEFKHSAKKKLRILLYPFLAIRFIIEQIAWRHFPVLDKNMFLTDSILERWLYYDIRSAYKGKIIPQYPIGPYWADFALPDYKLVIELDGRKYHKDRTEHDRRRDAYMHRLGWKVMRFSYQDVKKRRAQTIEKILDYTYKLDQQRKKEDHS
ncbi:endonuclease domain-containing protein [Lihuaxuella thermophila]|nr:DUF559 domain-containing protein [Lihuaxuella thermophila]